MRHHRSVWAFALAGLLLASCSERPEEPAAAVRPPADQATAAPRASPAPSPTPESGKVILTMKVLSHRELAHSTAMSSDGVLYHPDWMDLAVCEVVAPEAHAGRTVEIEGWNRRGGLVDSSMREEGAVVRIRCDASKLAEVAAPKAIHLATWEIEIVEPESP